jgi:hypothetical protein
MMVGVIVILAFVGYAFYSENNNLSSLSQQNANLAQQVSVLEQRTIQVVTMTNTVVSVETLTATVLTTTTSTSVVYPIPDNVTVAFTQASYSPSFQITTATTVISGTIYGSALVVPLNNLVQGELVTIGVACNSIGGQGATVLLYVNGQVVETTVCSGSTAQIEYSV